VRREPFSRLELVGLTVPPLRREEGNTIDSPLTPSAGKNEQGRPATPAFLASFARGLGPLGPVLGRYERRHRAFAAFLAMRERSFAESAFARAKPPFTPPSRPSATAFAFFGGSPTAANARARTTGWSPTSRGRFVFERSAISHSTSSCGKRSSRLRLTSPTRSSPLCTLRGASEAERYSDRNVTLRPRLSRRVRISDAPFNHYMPGTLGPGDLSRTFYTSSTQSRGAPAANLIKTSLLLANSHGSSLAFPEEP
jgi:hypothetical protein